MVDRLISDKALNLLEKSMDISARRHRMISNNIVNQDTMGFRPKDLDFNQALQREMAATPGPLNRTHSKHIRSGSAPDTSAGFQHDSADLKSGESVDIATEMTNLVENNIKYRTSVEMLLRKMTMLKTAIVEGGR